MFLLLTIAFLALKLGHRLLPPLLPIIIDDLSITPVAAGFALSLLTIVRAALQYPGGRFADNLTRKSVLITAIGFGLVGFGLLLGSVSYASFLVGVVFLGCGLGLYDPAARALLSDLFVEKRGRAFGLHIVAGDVAGMMAAGLAVVVVAVTWRLSFVPSILILTPVSAVLYLWGRERLEVGWIELDVRRTAMRLFATPQLRWALLAYSLIVFASMGITGFLAVFLIEVHGFSAAAASGTFALFYGVGLVVKPVAGWLSDQMPRLIVVGAAVSIGSVSLAGLIVAPTTLAVFASVTGYAAGQRAFPPPFQAYLMDMFPDTSMGGDLGAVRAIYMAIGSAGPVYVGYVAEQTTYVHAYASIIACFVGAGVIAFWLTATQ